MSDIADLLAEIRACRICRLAPERPLAFEPRPVLQLGSTARLLIAGQAPGTRAHASGRPFTDASGDRLRDWLGLDAEAFYDPARIAIAPMGFCFPGLDVHGSDLPPRRECAPAWRKQIMAALPAVELVLAVGRHAQDWHLGRRKEPLARTVADWRSILASTRPAVLPLPHPSWRNTGRLRRNGWFEAELLPELRKRVRALLEPG